MALAGIVWATTGRSAYRDHLADQGRSPDSSHRYGWGYNCWMPRKETPAKLARRMKRLRAKGEILGTVEAPDVAAAKAAAAVQFELDDVQRNRIMVQELK
jgi:hypothetical protein